MREFKFELMLSVTGFVTIKAGDLEEATNELINMSWQEVETSMRSTAEYEVLSATDENGDDVE